MQYIERCFICQSINSSPFRMLYKDIELMIMIRNVSRLIFLCGTSIHWIQTFSIILRGVKFGSGHFRSQSGENKISNYRSSLQNCFSLFINEAK